MSRTNGRGAAGHLVGAGAVISCPHGGRASAVSVPGSDAVLLDGVPVSTAGPAHTVVGCPHTVRGVPSPCTSVHWTPDEDVVRIDGVPVLLDTSAAQCFTAGLVPQGPPVVAPDRRGVEVG
ncbi:hypothetical protein HUT18_22375 [Streptomyces sp. NA04227]|uniref:hypothetical protein n=1 Tax=Streptomyces sp. NA04227 TaxID=2742136 RepID=UPI001590F314|nr:hypothetical protein [Streptomyces sp. NA04227]QKW08711.1 hypothetical protein HUT18_22375 [Streptomyces sp. NA04227]